MEGEGREQKSDHLGHGENQQSSQNDDIAQEIHRLVEAMARAARTAWSSEQRLQLEDDLRRGLGSLVSRALC